MLKSRMQRRLWVTYILLFLSPIILMATVGYIFLSSIMLNNARQEYQVLLNQSAELLEQDIFRLRYTANQFERTFWVERIVNHQGYSLNPNRISRYDLNHFRQHVIASRESLSLVDELGLYFPQKDLVIAHFGNSDFDFLINNAMRVEGWDSLQWQDIIYDLPLGSPIIIPGLTIQRYGVAHEKLLYVERIQPMNSIRPYCVLFATIRTSDINQHLTAISMNGQNEIAIADSYNRIFTSVGSEVLEIAVDLEYVSTLTGWTYSIRIPQSIVLRELILFRNMLLAFTAVLLLICGILSFSFSKRISTPIKELAVLLTPSFQTKSQDEVISLREGIQSILSKQNELSESLEEQCIQLRDSYIGMLLSGANFDANYLIKELDGLGVSLNQTYFQVGLLIRHSTSDTILLSLGTSLISTMLKEIQSKVVCIPRRIPSGCVLLFNYGSKVELVELVNALLEQVPGGVVALGGETYLPEEISKSCTRAVTISQYRYFSDGYNIILYEDYAAKMGLYYYPFEKGYSLSSLLSTGKRDEIMGLVNSLIYENTQREDVAPEGVRNLLMNISMDIARATLKNTTNNLLSVETLASMSTDGLQAYVLQMIESVCESMPDNDTQSLLLIRMKEYVDSALRSSELSLNMVADAFGVSPSFVSKLFAEKGNKHFHHYVNELRIGLAKPLLIDSNLTILEITKKVGYDSDITFRRQFKQHIGITPGIFRKTARNN